MSSITNQQDFENLFPCFYLPVLEIQQLINAKCGKFDELDDDTLTVQNNVFVTTADNLGITQYERLLDITTDVNRDIEERRSVVLSTLRGFGKISGTKIQAISSAYTNGDVTVAFDSPNSSIVVTFGGIGVPPNLTDLQNLLRTLIPAHLSLTYNIPFRTHSALTTFTHQQLNAHTHQTIREGTI